MNLTLLSDARKAFDRFDKPGASWLPLILLSCVGIACTAACVQMVANIDVQSADENVADAPAENVADAPAENVATANEKDEIQMKDDVTGEEATDE